MELKILAPTDGSDIQKVEFNYTELKTNLANQLKKFDGKKYTKEQYQEAKKDRASLNTFSKKLDEGRISTKKMYLEKFEEFEVQVKELQGMVNEQAEAIDKQIKVFELEEEEKKKEEIKMIYSNVFSTLSSLVSLEKIFNQKWLNKGFTIPKIEDEIRGKYIKITDEIKAIEGLNSEQTTTLMEIYLRNLELSAALTEHKRQEDMKARIEKQRKAEETKKAEAKAAEIKKEPEPTVVAPVVQPVIEPESSQTPPPQETKTEALSLQEIAFRVWVTPEQKEALKQFIKDNNIKVGRV